MTIPAKPLIVQKRKNDAAEIDYGVDSAIQIHDKLLCHTSNSLMVYNSKQAPLV